MLVYRQEDITKTFDVLTPKQYFRLIVTIISVIDLFKIFSWQLWIFADLSSSSIIFAIQGRYLVFKNSKTFRNWGRDNFYFLKDSIARRNFSDFPIVVRVAYTYVCSWVRVIEFWTNTYWLLTVVLTDRR